MPTYKDFQELDQDILRATQKVTDKVHGYIGLDSIGQSRIALIPLALVGFLMFLEIAPNAPVFAVMAAASCLFSQYEVEKAYPPPKIGKPPMNISILPITFLYAVFTYETTPLGILCFLYVMLFLLWAYVACCDRQMPTGIPDAFPNES